MNKKGLFITFEGADGSGKTTQMEKVTELLKDNGYDVVATREPGALEVGQKIRDIVLHYKGEVSANCEMFLFLADRAQHVDTFIKPLLKKNIIVLCDRYTDSTVAYQGYGRNNNVEQTISLNDIATSNLAPDLTIVFDIDTEIAQERVGKTKDRLESAGIEFHEKVRKGYLELANKYPHRIRVVNANNSVETVYNETKNIIIDFITQQNI